MKPSSPPSAPSRRIQYLFIPFLLPLCLIALGILLLVNASLVTKIFLSFGVLCALVGLIEVVIYISRRPYEVQTPHLIHGIAWLIGGGALILIPLTVGTLIPALIGLCILAAGISGISNTITFRQGSESVLIPMLLAAANCLMGIFILIYVLINPHVGWKFLGIFMIISGVLRICNELFARISLTSPGANRNRSQPDVIDANKPH